MTTSTRQKKTPASPKKMTPDAEQKVLVDSFRASMPDLKISVDEYLRDKYAATDAENRK